jgi:hypothetical protein
VCKVTFLQATKDRFSLVVVKVALKVLELVEFVRLKKLNEDHNVCSSIYKIPSNWISLFDNQPNYHIFS